MMESLKMWARNQLLPVWSLHSSLRKYSNTLSNRQVKRSLLNMLTLAIWSHDANTWRSDHLSALAIYCREQHQKPVGISWVRELRNLIANEAAAEQNQRTGKHGKSTQIYAVEAQELARKNLTGSY